jgi:hypothetical protein
MNVIHEKDEVIEETPTVSLNPVEISGHDLIFDIV